MRSVEWSQLEMGLNNERSRQRKISSRRVNCLYSLALFFYIVSIAN